MQQPGGTRRKPGANELLGRSRRGGPGRGRRLRGRGGVSRRRASAGGADLASRGPWDRPLRVTRAWPPARVLQVLPRLPVPGLYECRPGHRASAVGGWRRAPHVALRSPHREAQRVWWVPHRVHAEDRAPERLGEGAARRGDRECGTLDGGSTGQQDSISRAISFCDPRLDTGKCYP